MGKEAYNQLFTLIKRFFFLLSSFFFVVVFSSFVVSGDRLLGTAWNAVYTLINSLKLSAAVFSTLKLQNSEVISGSHHVDQLVEENKKRL